MRLHAFAQSGNSYKVALALRALGLPFECVYVDYFGGATREAAWREAHNPLGEIPVLEVDGRMHTQSGAILLWLAEREGRYGGRDAEEREEVLRWILFDNHKFTSYFATWRYMKSFAATPPDPAVLAFLRPRIDAAFGIVDAHLRGRDWLVGDQPSVADFSLVAYLCYPQEESGIDVPALWPSLATWVGRVRQMPGWADPYELLPGPKLPPRW